MSWLLPEDEAKDRPHCTVTSSPPSLGSRDCGTADCQGTAQSQGPPHSSSRPDVPLALTTQPSIFTPTRGYQKYPEKR